MPRVPIALEVGYKVEPLMGGPLLQGTPTDSGQVENLNRNGCCLRTAHPLQAQQIVRIQAPLAGKTELSIPTLAEVRWVKTVSPGAQPGAEAAEPKAGLKGIHAMSLFTSLTQEECEDVVKQMQPSRVFPPGAVIVEEGTESNYSLSIITRGAVKVTTRQQGQEIVHGTLRENDFFGETTFFTKGRRTASITAILETEIAELKETNLVALIERHPRVGEVLRKFYKTRGTQTVERLPIYVAGCRFLL